MMSICPPSGTGLKGTSFCNVAIFGSALSPPEHSALTQYSSEPARASTGLASSTESGEPLPFLAAAPAPLILRGVLSCAR